MGTVLLVGILLLNSDDLGQHGTQPLGVNEVKITELTVLIVKQDA